MSAIVRSPRLARWIVISQSGWGIPSAKGKNRAAPVGGNFCLASPRDQFTKIMRITALDRVFAVYDSLGEAVAASEAE
jgi:hypothetical protein